MLLRTNGQAHRELKASNIRAKIIKIWFGVSFHKEPSGILLETLQASIQTVDGLLAATIQAAYNDP